jgi:hypothetical protein
MGMIDAQYKDQVIKDLRKDLEALYGCFKEVSEVNVSLRKEIKMLEKLIELNMKDLWDIADQRDWYYEEYWKLRDKKS